MKIGISKKDYNLMLYCEFIDLLTCYKIEQGALKLAVTDDEIMFPPELE